MITQIDANNNDSVKNRMVIITLYLKLDTFLGGTPNI